MQASPRRRVRRRGALWGVGRGPTRVGSALRSLAGRRGPRIGARRSVRRVGEHLVLVLVVLFVVVLEAVLGVPAAHTRAPERLCIELLATRTAHKLPVQQRSIVDACPPAAARRRWGDRLGGYAVAPLSLQICTHRPPVIVPPRRARWPRTLRRRPRRWPGGAMSPK